MHHYKKQFKYLGYYICVMVKTKLRVNALTQNLCKLEVHCRYLIFTTLSDDMYVGLIVKP